VIFVDVQGKVSYVLDGLGSIPRRGRGFFSIPQLLDRPWSPPSFLSSGNQGLSLGVKRPGREAYHTLSSAEIKNELYLHV
jgi:hypothetical protein